MSVSEVFVVGAALFCTSVFSLMILARPFVTLHDCEAEIRNPIRVYRVPLRGVAGVGDGFLGFPKLTLGADSRRIYLMGMEESFATKLAGGSMDIAVLEAEVNTCSGAAARGGEPTQLQADRVLVDRWLLLLLAAWTIYVASFFW
jgi:hypothetical protein